MNFLPPQQAEFDRALDFYGSVFSAFQKGVAATEILDRYYAIAGLHVCLRFAGPALIPKLTPALEHLRQPAADSCDLTIHLFDSQSTGIDPPPPPWGRNDYQDHGEIRGYNNHRIRTVFQGGGNTLQMLDLHKNQGLLWVRSPAAVTHWEAASPMRVIFHLWLRTRSVQFVHAAAVGREDGGLLLVGKGGSGKSTTSLACLDSGLKFLGDDYCLVRSGEVPIVHSLYSSGKKNADDIERLDFLKPYISNTERLADEKAVYYIHQHFPERVINSFPLKAILVPKITENDHPRLTTVATTTGLMALAPSTIFQLPGSGAEDLARMADIVRNVPCYGLELAGNVKGTPQLLERLLDKLQDGQQ